MSMFKSSYDTNTTPTICQEFDFNVGYRLIKGFNMVGKNRTHNQKYLKGTGKIFGFEQYKPSYSKRD